LSENEERVYIKSFTKKNLMKKLQLMVKGFGGVLTKLTDEQQDYIGVRKMAHLKKILIHINLI
jgi:S-adenosylhomocysteine hydrolase